jgi:hypothetical protein
MSTPFRHAKHIDPALMYAPPRVRGGGLVPTEPFGSAVKNSDHGSAPLESRADRAIVRAQRRLALDPELVPEPTQSQPDGQFYRRIAVPAVGILGLAAVIAWLVVVSIPSVRSLLKTDAVRAGLQGTSVSTIWRNKTLRKWRKFRKICWNRAADPTRARSPLSPRSHQC